MIFNEVSITKFALIVCGCGYAALHAEVHDVHRKSHEAGEAFCITGRSDHLGPGTCWMSYFWNLGGVDVLSLPEILAESMY